MMNWVLTFASIAILFSISGAKSMAKDSHGRMKMGISACDDGKSGLEIDWANETNYEYTCQSNETYFKTDVTTSSIKLDIVPSHQCLPDSQRNKFPSHKCMNTEIEYSEKIPSWGNHRPVWPRYGEYLYLPPQRWLHSLEHKGTAFLYHPCADPAEVDKLRNFARSCFYRWVMTPNRNLDETFPFAVVTFGCTYKMARIDEVTLKAYLKKHSLKDGLEIVYADGDYDFALLRSSYPEDLQLLHEEKICNNDEEEKHENDLINDLQENKVNSNLKDTQKKKNLEK